MDPGFNPSRDPVISGPRWSRHVEIDPGPILASSDFVGWDPKMTTFWTLFGPLFEGPN